MNDDLLPDFSFTPNDYGWSAPLPAGSPRLFGKEVSLDISTRALHTSPEILPPISKHQASLVRLLIPALSALVQRVESELTAYHQKYEPGFQSVIRDPNIWLSCESDDGVSWTFVVGRTDNPDFGYHAEFRGTDFIELWAGD